MVTTSDPTPALPNAPTTPRAWRTDRILVDTVLVLACGALIWALAARSLLLDGGAVAACLLGGATAVARLDSSLRHGVAAAVASAALSIAVLLSSARLWAPDPTVASAFMVLGAVALALSGWEQREPGRRWLYVLVIATILLGPVSSLWFGDDRVSVATALRLLAASLAVTAGWTASGDWRRLAPNVCLAGAAVFGVTSVAWREAELLAVAGVGLLVLHRWWRHDGEPAMLDRRR